MIQEVSKEIKAYFRLEYDKTSKATPKYNVTQMWGYYPPLEKLRSRKSGKITMYLLSKREGQPSNTPKMRLQAARSLNFTGLKDYFVDGKVSGYAYGNPPKGQTYPYRGGQETNPFAEYQGDGFLFVVHQDGNNLLPDCMEVLVIGGANANVMAARYVKQLEMGGYDGDLQQLRGWAKNI